jgi:hypothetical protein
MNWIRTHRPSPATAIALAALVVALGGAAFAAIPDSNGTIHACAQRTTGKLRVVNQAGDCRNNETPIAWADGSHASRVVARARSASPVETTTADFGRGQPSVGTLVPMNDATWVQGPGETDHFYGEVTYTTPDCPPEISPGQSRFDVFVFVGDRPVASGGTVTGDTNTTVPSGGTVPINPFFVNGGSISGFLFEAGAATNRNLTVRATDNCGQGKHVRIDSVKLNVDGVS